jgi:hypothetical protein
MIVCSFKFLRDGTITFFYYIRYVYYNFVKLFELAHSHFTPWQGSVHFCDIYVGTGRHTPSHFWLTRIMSTCKKKSGTMVAE